MRLRILGYVLGVTALMTLWFLLPLNHSVAAQKAASANPNVPDCADAAPNETCVYTGKAPVFPYGNLCIGCSKDGKTTPRAPDGHPDLNGYWANTEGEGTTVIKRADGTIGDTFGDIRNPSYARPGQARQYDRETNEPPYKPEYFAKAKAMIDQTAIGGQKTTPLDPVMACKPEGIPRSGPPSDITQTPSKLVFLYENGGAIGVSFSIIYTDGRPHPKDIDSSYMGDSVGHWEGDALVVDVIGLNDETWLGGARYALMHSEQEHVIERYTRNGDMLTYEATVEDPVVFTKPWVTTPRHVKHAGAGFRLLGESYCDNQDLNHLIKPVKWELRLQGGGSHTLILSEDAELDTGENTIEGTLDGKDVEGVRKGDKISFSILQTPAGSAPQKFEGTITGNSMKGTTNGQSQQGWTAKKSNQ